MKFKFKKEAIDWNEIGAIRRFRRECEDGARRFGKLPSGIEVIPVVSDGLAAEWIAPSQTARDKV